MSESIFSAMPAHDAKMRDMAIQGMVGIHKEDKISVVCPVSGHVPIECGEWLTPTKEALKKSRPSSVKTREGTEHPDAASRQNSRGPTGSSHLPTFGPPEVKNTARGDMGIDADNMASTGDT